MRGPDEGNSLKGRIYPLSQGSHQYTSVLTTFYHGVPCIASDVCYRPEKTILFRNRDIADLYRVARDTLHNNKSIQDSSKAQKVNNAKLFIDVFKQAARVEG